MSRKRPQLSTEAPAAKRHLNAALAAELQTLRISRGTAHPIPPARRLFGASVAPSPFLTPFSTRIAPQYTNDSDEKQSSQGMRFGSEFAESLSRVTSETDKEAIAPEVVMPMSPSSSSSSVSMAVDEDVAGRKGSISPPLEDSGESEIIVEDVEAPADSENRLVVYRPPVRTPSTALSRLNARLPEGQYLLRNPRADEWIVREAQNESVKRKLALVPWMGDVKKICGFQRSPAKVIPMPWRDSQATVVEIDNDDMEIEDVS